MHFWHSPKTTLFVLLWDHHISLDEAEGWIVSKPHPIKMKLRRRKVKLEAASLPSLKAFCSHSAALGFTNYDIPELTRGDLLKGAQWRTGCWKPTHCVCQGDYQNVSWTREGISADEAWKISRLQVIDPSLPIRIYPGSSVCWKPVSQLASPPLLELRRWSDVFVRKAVEHHGYALLVGLPPNPTHIVMARTRRIIRIADECLQVPFSWKLLNDGSGGKLKRKDV